VNAFRPDSSPLAPDEVQVEILGRSIRIQNGANADSLSRSMALLEKTFQDMERAYELRWGCPPTALDTSTWVLMGALNLAHQVVHMEQEVSQQTQNLEQTLTKLLDDVPDENPAPGALLGGQD
jgi:cell division protein ZapA (FtsZ GTPase activity inhibitor)